MRIVFMGTPDFAVPALRALTAARHEVVCAYTQPPRPGGRRGRELTPSPVQQEAEAMGIPVRYPASLKGATEQAEFAGLNADIGIVAAFGLILPEMRLTDEATLPPGTYRIRLQGVERARPIPDLRPE